MKTIISLLVGCSLALAGAALAQQPVEQQSPSKGKRAPEKARAPEVQPRPNAAKSQERPANQTGATREHKAPNDQGATNENEHGATHERGATNEPGAEKGRKTHADRESANAPETKPSGQTTEGARNESAAEKNRKARAHDESANTLKPGEKQQAEKQRKDVNERGTAAKTSGSPPAAGTKPVPPSSAGGKQNAQVNTGAKGKKPAPQQVQQVKTQHANFRAQPKPQQVPAVTFNQNHRIEGSDRWQGQQYQVFRAYRPEWHDEGWYRSHYANVALIGGGYYYFNQGYWFPAWGYSASAQYYPYDGPIYAGHGAQPPDQVIANTQALLQQMGYYTGEVDGLLGPLTRQALTAYQADQGLATTASIDQPTLDSLGLA